MKRREFKLGSRTMKQAQRLDEYGEQDVRVLRLEQKKHPRAGARGLEIDKNTTHAEKA